MAKLMSLRQFRLLLTAFIAPLIIAGCGGKGSSAEPPAGGLTVSAGDTQATVTFTAAPGVEYWLFYAPGTSISSTNLKGIPGALARLNIGSPYVVTGLTNGTTYSFTINGRVDNGPGGPDAAVVSVVPRLAGTTMSGWKGQSGTLGTTDMHGVVYGSTTSVTTGTYVAAGYGGVIYSSTDGITWTAVNTSSTIDMTGVTNGLGRFIAVGLGGRVLSSTDLVTWTESASGTTQNLYAVATGGSISVAVGANGTIRYSTDVGTWTAAASVPTTNHLYGVTYTSSGLWIAVGANGTLLTSGDGSTWTSATTNTTADLKSAGFAYAATGGLAASTYVAVGAGGTVLKSTDGTTWTVQTLSPAVNLNGVVVTNQFVVVGTGGAAFTSLDGITWSNLTTTPAKDLFGLTKASNQYIAVGAAGTALYAN